MQTTQRPAVYLQLTPMQLPLGRPQAEQALSSWQLEGGDVSSTSALRLSPQEPSELLIQIHNTSKHNLPLTLRVIGDIPPTWYEIHTEGSMLNAGQSMEALLYFRLPDDFFENHQALRPQQALKLNYHGQIQVYQLAPGSNGVILEQNNRGSLISSQAFDLYVRPHSLYPNFLPEIYQEVDFIGRFLSLFEQAFEPSVNQLQSLWAYLDPLTAPQGMLPFLAHWVGWPSELRWSPQKQRRLIRQAIELYRWRGTRRGLRLYLSLYTGLPETRIEIRESFTQGFVVGGETYLGETTLVGGGQPFHFTVQLLYQQSRDEGVLDEALIHRIIEQEKPAFCTYDLQIRPAPE